jgi:hypothetical protein
MLDQVPSQDFSKRPVGIIYNSAKPVGGIRYYKNPNQKSVVVASLKNDSGEKSHNSFVYVEQTLDIENSDPSTETNNSSTGYQISVMDQVIDFSAEGIAAPELSEDDLAWLQKAQHYFINATQDQRRIGSAKEYTHMDLLQALWATAEQTGIDPKRFIVQIFNESRFNPHLMGQAGERGLGQFKRSTAEMLGYDWNKMTGGVSTYAYQAKAAAEFVAKVGEERYNGAGPSARKYRFLISSRLRKINRTRVSAA